MGKPHVVLILGTGSNADYVFPNGNQLVTKIRDEFPVDYDTLSDGQGHDAHKLAEAIRGISRPTIDDFLADRPDWAEKACWGIAHILFKCERRAIAFLQSEKNNWYRSLWSWLAPPGEVPKFPQYKVSILTYNYDRSLEYFLFATTKYASKPSRSEEYLRKLVNKVPIVHLHGRLGRLPWQKGDKIPVVPFGPDPSSSSYWGQVLDAANSIKVVHQPGVENSREFKRALEILITADMVIFMGVGYHETNMRRLRLGETLKENASIIGTTVGFDKRNINRVRNLFRECIGPKRPLLDQISLINKIFNCYKFVTEQLPHLKIFSK